MSRRRPVWRGLVGLLVGFGGAVVTLAAIDQLGDGRTATPLRRGPLDIEGYCSRDDDMIAMLIAPDPYGWQCVGYRGGVWDTYDVDADGVCHWQYGDRSYAVLVVPNDTVGWACFSGG